MCPRPQHHAPDPLSAAERELERCLHAESRIRIDVTVDLGFVYCTECDRRLWWTRTRGVLSGEAIRNELGGRERSA
jgi:hypothetical protein